MTARAQDDTRSRTALSAKRPWTAPALTPLPRLTELTLQTGGGIPGGGGVGGGGSTVIP